MHRRSNAGGTSATGCQATFDLQVEAHRQAHAVAHSPQAEEDQEFVEAISADVWRITTTDMRKTKRKP